MNYINHVNNVFTLFCEDTRLSTVHISLYHCLFQYWNMARFKNPISIARSELMFIAKINNPNTYIKCIKELSEYGYIKYEPSYNPSKGSLVYLYEFDKGIDKGINKAKNNAENNAFVILNTPSINNTQTNTTNNTKTETIFLSKNSLAKKQSSKRNNFVSEEKINEKGHTERVFSSEVEKRDGGDEKEKLRQKKKLKVPNLGLGILPSLAEVNLFFSENAYSATEAEKFFNHFESNGWLVSGKSPMKNWKAAARNWMLNAQKFAAKKVVALSEVEKRKPNSLHVNQNKNYAEPL